MSSKNTKNWLQIDSVDQKLFKIQYTVCGNFSQGAGTSGTGSDIAFSQLAVKGLSTSTLQRAINILKVVLKKKQQYTITVHYILVVLV
jgi:hypothetical protein